MRNKHFNRSFWFATLLWCGALAPAFAATFAARLVPDTIRHGEQATLTLELSGAQAKALPSIAPVPNLTFAFAGQSTEWSMVNGQQSAKVTHIYRVIAAQPGDYTIPGITPVTDIPVAPSQPLKLKVLPGNAPAPPPPGLSQADLDRLAFIKLIVRKNEVYLGEVFPVEIRLYFQSGQDVQLPNLRCDGFTVNKMIHSQTREQIGNAIYNVIVFNTIAVPAKAGRLDFGPAECNLTIRVPAPQVDPFSPPYSLKQVSPKTETLALNVLPLPKENQPPGFNGAVGNYSMAMNAGPTNLTVGDPLTVKIQIAGKGAFDNVLLPLPDSWREFKSYQANARLEAPDLLSTSGVKSFEQILIPQNAEIKKLPGISFSFFDPEAKAYRVLTQPDIPLNVRPSEAAAQQPTVISNLTAAAQAPPPAKDLVHIKTHLGLVADIQPPLLRQTWFQVLQSIPVLAWLALFIRRKQQERLANNPRLRREREVARIVASGLQQLHSHAQDNEAEKFFEMLFHLLQEQLGERLDVPASAITESIITDRLRPGGWPEETLTALQELFQICNQARYAPHRSSQELAALVPKVESVLGQLRGAATHSRRG